MDEVVEAKLLEELKVSAVALDYFHDPQDHPPDRPHVFVYTYRIENLTHRYLTLIARKIIIRRDDGHTEVRCMDEVERFFRELEPGEYQTVSGELPLPCGATVSGAYHGMDAAGAHVWAALPKLRMAVPGETEA